MMSLIGITSFNSFKSIPERKLHLLNETDRLGCGGHI